MRTGQTVSPDIRCYIVLPALIAVLWAVLAPTSNAQSFSSGSDGSDGALIVPANGGTVIFDPLEESRWGRVLDADGDGVYNFTTVSIGASTILRLRGDKVNRPMYWLATGDIVIAGGAILDLSGVDGLVTTDWNLRRFGALPGPGGFAGGVGGYTRTAGEGPGGGSGGGVCSIPNFLCGRSGTFSGNRYLIPLIGGSGGEGAQSNDGTFRGGGGGGGAILLASSTSITITGAVWANGGHSAGGGAHLSGAGSGGAIRVVTPTILGGGTLLVNPGTNPLGFAGEGIIRLEAFSTSGSLLTGPNTAVTRGTPVDQSTLRPGTTLKVTAVDGILVPQNPRGSLFLADVPLNKTGPVNVDIEAHGIPPGTVVTLQIFSQTPTNLDTINLSTTATLSGTVEASTATAQFTFPYGFSRGFLRATWTP